jgi:sugar phosphate isomerase/epimerase
MYSRRDLGKLALAGLPLSIAKGAPGDSGVRLGAATTSLRDLVRTPGKDNVDDVIAALKFAGVTEIELASANTEPAGPNSGPAVPPAQSAYPPPITAPTPEQVAAARLAVRNSLRDWRMRTRAAGYDATRAKFQSAGIGLFAYRVDYDEQFTEDEIDITFQQAKALGVGTIATLTPLRHTARLAPWADKFGITVALHNSSSDTAAALTSALGMSKRFRINLDIGNFTAANQEAVAFIQENHQQISHIQIKDRTRNGGGNERFGEGDTPIREVVALVKSKKLAMPVIVEYEYVGLGTPQVELKKCMAYVKALV